MIVSASYKTDIPAFYGEWLLNRLQAGFCRARNPVSGKPFTVSLRRADVDGLVFWTKNPWPFLPRLTEVASLGYPFYFQFTITPYDRIIERSVITPERAIEAAREIHRRHGAGRVVWRYDPIIIGEESPAQWHLARFKDYARRLEGVTDEVATKFVLSHRKAVRHLSAIGLRWSDPPLEQKRDLLGQLNEIARDHGIRLTVCAQPEAAEGMPKSICLDADRLNRLGASIRSVRTESNRPDCLCHQARDIGEYDTCPQGCAYCYANMEQSLAARNHSLHDPMADSLLPIPVEVDLDQASLF